MTVVRVEKVEGVNTVVCAWGDKFKLEDVQASFPDQDIREDVITAPSLRELAAHPEHTRRDDTQVGAIEVDGVFVDPPL